MPTEVSSEPVSLDQLKKNLELEKACFKLLRDIISVNDKALVANLLDLSKKVIISTEDLIKLIKLGVGKCADVVIDSDIDSASCHCCKHKVNIRVYENIYSITINGEELEDCEPELYEFLTDYCNISLTKTYKKRVFDIERIEE